MLGGAVVAAAHTTCTRGGAVVASVPAKKSVDGAVVAAVHAMSKSAGVQSRVGRMKCSLLGRVTAHFSHVAEVREVDGVCGLLSFGGV